MAVNCREVQKSLRCAERVKRSKACWPPPNPLATEWIAQIAAQAVAHGAHRFDLLARLTCLDLQGEGGALRRQQGTRAKHFSNSAA